MNTSKSLPFTGILSLLSVFSFALSAQTNGHQAAHAGTRADFEAAMLAATPAEMIAPYATGESALLILVQRIINEPTERGELLYRFEVMMAHRPGSQNLGDAEFTLLSHVLENWWLSGLPGEAAHFERLVTHLMIPSAGDGEIRYENEDLFELFEVLLAEERVLEAEILGRLYTFDINMRDSTGAGFAHMFLQRYLEVLVGVGDAEVFGEDEVPYVPAALAELNRRLHIFRGLGGDINAVNAFGSSIFRRAINVWDIHAINLLLNHGVTFGFDELRDVISLPQEAQMQPRDWPVYRQTVFAMMIQLLGPMARGCKDLEPGDDDDMGQCPELLTDVEITETVDFDDGEESIAEEGNTSVLKHFMHLLLLAGIGFGESVSIGAGGAGGKF